MMLEKLMQAAIITFLLHLIVGLNPTASVGYRQRLPEGKAQNPVAKLQLQFNP